MNKLLFLAALSALLYTAVMISNATDEAMNRTASSHSQSFGG